MATRSKIRQWMVFCGLMGGISAALLTGMVWEVHAEEPVQERGELAAVLKDRVGLEQAWQNLPSAEEIERLTQALLSQPLSLEDALRIALLNHAGLQADLQQLEITRALTRQKMRLVNPALDGSVWFDKDGLGEIDASLMFDVASLIHRSVLGTGAKQEITIARLEASAAVIGFIERVRVAYYEYLALEKAYESAEQLNAAAQAASKAASLLFEAGNLTQLEAVTQHAMAADSLAALQETRAELRTSRQRLHVLLGIDAAKKWSISTEVQAFSVPSEDVQTLQEQAVARSLRLQELRVGQDLSRTRSRLNSWQRWLPILEIGVSGEAKYENGIGNETEYLIGPAVRIAIPLFGSPVPFDAEIVRADFESRAEVRAIELQVGDVYEQLQLASEHVELFRNQVLPLRAQVVEQAQLQFNASGIDIFALVTARQMQIQAERDYIRALRRGLLLSAQMETLMAGGALGAPVSEVSQNDSQNDLR